MSIDELLGLVPPPELRGPLGNVMSSGGATPTSVSPPSVITGGGPGLAAGAPTPVAAPPTVPSFDDPIALTRMISQLAGELFNGASLVPVPLAPIPASSAAGGLSPPASPGIAPQMVAATPPGASSAIEPPASPASLTGGIAPILMPTSDPSALSTVPLSSTSAPSPASAAPATPSPTGAPPTMPPAGAPGPQSVTPPPVPTSASLPSPFGPPVFNPSLLLGVHPPGTAPFAELLRFDLVDNRGHVAAPPGTGHGNGRAPANANTPASASMPAATPTYGNAPVADTPKSASTAAPYHASSPDHAGSHQGPSPGRPSGPSPSPFSPTSGSNLRLDAHEHRPERIPVRTLGGVAFDPYAVRRDFPILDENIRGRRLVWLDNAATTQKPRAVIDRLSYFYAHENSNVHRAAHTLAARSTDAYEAGRESTRRFLNAPSTENIVFVRGATEGINLIAQSWGRRHVNAGDEIVITWLEHHANIVPWQQLCAERGARLRIAPVDDRGDVILEEYERLFNPRTRLASFTQVSNALGTITPAREMVDIAHRHGATVVVDGAQAVSHMQVDVQALDCDFYVFSGHKVFAPTGIGVVYGKRDVLAAMPPWQGGGNMIQDVTFEKTTYQPPPGRFEAGTGSIADAVGLGAALDYIQRIGMETIDRYEHELLVYATERLLTIPGLRLIGTAPRKAGVLSFVLEGRRTEDMGSLLDQEGIAVRSGHHCAQPILRRFGLEASIRASLAFYNVCEDIDALVDALRKHSPGRR